MHRRVEGGGGGGGGGAWGVEGFEGVPFTAQFANLFKGLHPKPMLWPQYILVT